MFDPLPFRFLVDTAVDLNPKNKGRGKGPTLSSTDDLQGTGSWLWFKLFSFCTGFPEWPSVTSTERQTPTLGVVTMVLSTFRPATPGPCTLVTTNFFTGKRPDGNLLDLNNVLRVSTQIKLLESFHHLLGPTTNPQTTTPRPPPLGPDQMSSWLRRECGGLGLVRTLSYLSRSINKILKNIL